MQVDALEDGSAFAELSTWRAMAVRGDDAGAWLHDLVTADVEGLEPGQSHRSLLLTPTGRIRADFHIARTDDGFLLLQASDQTEAVDTILAPYVLSSDVELEDRTERSAVVVTPSVLGAGFDLVLPPGAPVLRLRERLQEQGLVEVNPEDIETWRIRRGIARMGADFGPDALPAEAGLEGTIDLTKGCFLGQESVAKVRNLGHPPRVLRLVRSGAAIRSGAPVLARGVTVGEVTSAAERNGETDAIVRIRWDAASEPLSTEAGPLSLRREQ